MKYTWNKAAWALLAGPLLFTACKKNDKGELNGPLPTVSFTSAINATQFPVTVTFTDNSQDSFTNTWDFGDNTRGQGKTVTHTYIRPGSYQVQLIAAGRAGSATSPQQTVVIPSACDNAGFSALTACSGSGAASWIISKQPEAIVRLAANGTTVLSSLPVAGGTLPDCQLDDQFTFATNFAYAYDAGGQTYSNGACGPAREPNSNFVYKPVAGSLGQIILQNPKAKSFIGLTDSVVNKTYDLVEATAARLRLRGTNPDGTFTVVTYIPQLSAVDKVKQLLTNGSSKTWMLDNTVDKPIAVGPSDADPTSYYAGGPAGSLPGCQADDEFTFSNANVYTYDAKAETFVAGATGGCQAPRSGTSPFTFGAATGAGIAQFTLGTAGRFIGVTDAPDLTYRILSIDAKHMVLRAGSSTGSLVFTMKLVAK
ncbi:PKD domain-containing protein [Hymenobacter sp. PAMC 26628]|uniref:PKD domain-containing protein n=1 Tax=Hymenobacter sp. PAMC 26628 TaxID=1484118 RepID=UPI000770263B|nr:PKD domain-containing protein [Hymenobacter sp. PAMC 26628]AMJ66263.1 hypothetical protein AXW84_13065 [Hymenobacter sp. PAMC 26628]